jgi:hypothetical protein
MNRKLLTLHRLPHAPRQGETSGRIKDYRIYIGDKLIQAK